MISNQSLRNKIILITKILFLEIYSFLTTIIENIVFKKRKIKNDLNTNGYKIYNLKSNATYEKLDFQQVQSNKYLKKYILSERSISKLVDDLFIKNNLLSLITNETGFAYSIDFVTAYETFHIDNSDIKIGWYANQWHRDKPFSKNTLKLVFPLHKITHQHGGIQIKNKLDDEKIFNMTANLNEFLIFLPNQCFHKAGNPEINFSRKQIMMQLNPSNTWKINSNLYKRQDRIEPKFPMITYLFDKKIRVN